jgi:2-polyprenyl-3-methyl-5-hydroxy-6-metoxy-1,4-benzoquinol methylase
MSKFWNDELNVGYYDKIVESGNEKGRGLRSYWHITTLNRVLDFIEKNSVHLDYACGPGTLIGLSLSQESVGVDLSSNQIQYANDKYSKNGKFYTVEEFNISKFSNKFDIVTVLGLIEFLNDQEIKNLINKIDITLKVGGKIILTTPNFKGVMKILEKIQNYFGAVDYRDQHINKFNKKRLRYFSQNFKNFEFNMLSFLNISFIFSIFSHKLSRKIENFIARIFNNKFGSLFLIELTKKS